MKRVRYVLLIGLVGFIPFLNASAQEKSRELMSEGITEMKKGDYSSALGKFNAAAAEDPSKEIVFFLQGWALNRVGKYQQAITALNKHVAAGGNYVETDFELGWSYMRLGKWKKAIKHLESYEKKKPGRGQTSEFLGRCYAEKGQYAKAEALLKQALQRDPELASTVDLYRARISVARGHKEKAEHHLMQVVQRGAEKSGSGKNAMKDPAARQALHSLKKLRDLDASANQRWHLSFGTSAGWDDNVIAVGDTIALPEDISDEESPFWKIEGQVNYHLLSDDRQGLTVGYVGEYTLYEQDFEDANLFDNYGYIQYYRHYGKFTPTILIGDQYTLLGGDSFRNRFDVRPSIYYRVHPNTTIELAYTYTDEDYKFPVPFTSANNRDGESHAFSLRAYFDLPNTDWRGQVGYRYQDRDTVGANYDAEAHSLFAGVSGPLWGEVTLSVNAEYQVEDYDNPNTFSATGANREDDLWYLSVELSRPIELSWWEKPLTAYIHYTHWGNDSNVAIFDYDRNIIAVGIKTEF